MVQINVRPEEDLQAVLDCAPEGAEVRLAPGAYRRKLVIRVPSLTLRGAGAEKTVLVWDDYAKKTDAVGALYNTFRTWTLAVCAPGVSIRDLSVVNDSLCPEEKGQEVALTVYGDAFSMENCVLRSTQDTLFCGPLPPDLCRRYTGFLPEELRRPGPCRQRFTRCRIEGTVDFIFGCGDVLFEDCEIRSLYEVRGTGYAAAPAHTPEQTDGFCFRRCAFTCEPSVPPGSVYLARPWRDYGLARFEDCVYGPHVAAAGFDKWSGTQRDRTARFFETPPVPGRVPWVK